MINIRTFFTSIPQFFHLLWASIVALFIFQEKEDQLPGDIEAAIPTSNVVGGLEKETVTEPTKDVQSDTRFLVPPTAGFVEIDLKNNRNINYDHPSRRPSRRISAVDPVKSRIVDAALKQVQDKTINVIKTVVLTPCTVIAIPCSAKIEYYDPRTENRGVQFGLMKNRPNFKKRAVQFVLPSIFIEEILDVPARKLKITKKDRESIADLFDLFPHPPTHVPLVPPPPVAIRDIAENSTNSFPSPIGLCPSLVVTDNSTYASYAESVSSPDSCASNSDDTAQTSLPSTPESAMSSFATSKSELPDVGLHNNAQLSPDTTIGLLPSGQTIADDQILRKAESAETLRNPLLIKNALDVEDYAIQETVATVNSAESSLLPAQVVEGVRDLVPENFVASYNPEDLVERYHNVADGSNKADLQKGDIFDGTDLKEKEIIKVSRADDIRDILTMSPSEDAVVEFLLVQLETSFELDERRSDPLPWLADKNAVGEEVYVAPDIKAHLDKPIAPLRIVKKNKFQHRGQEEERVASGSSWEKSLEKVLKAFKEAEVEDSDFRDLFYRDSSFFSQSSLVNNLRELKEESSTSFEVSRDERLKRFDESFESVEKSVEEILSALELLPDTVAVKAEDSASISLSGRMVIKDIVPDAVKPDSMSSHDRIAVRDDDEDDEDPYTWTAVSNDDADDEENESEDDQWSNLFELDAYRS